MAATTKERWIVVVAIFIAVATLARWYWAPQGPLPDEVRVCQAIRNAESLYLTTSVGAKEFHGDRLSLDGESLASRFRLKNKRDQKDLSVRAIACLCETPGKYGEVVMLLPPDSVFVGRNLYAVDSSFWTELLRQAPKTKQWLLAVAPNLFDDLVESKER